MAKIYYGQGECTLDPKGKNIRGVEIVYTGNANFQLTAGENFTLMNGNGRILIFPIGEGYLTDLFIYKGLFNIQSVKVADENAQKVVCYIKRVMDYTELLESNSEDMTLNSEDYSSAYHNVEKNIEENKWIGNLNTSFPPTPLYFKNGDLYTGDFHIHKDTGQAMTGATHTKDSENLYIKQDKEAVDRNKQIRRDRKALLKSTEAKIKESSKAATNRRNYGS
jgi:hypothetical protein